MPIVTSGSHLRGHGVNMSWVVATWAGRVGEGKSHKSRVINLFVISHRILTTYIVYSNALGLLYWSNFICFFYVVSNCLISSI